MKCPLDQETLVLAERQGIEIDYCPRCRGVWLDRGELDKLVEREGDRYEADPPRRDRDDLSGALDGTGTTTTMTIATGCRGRSAGRRASSRRCSSSAATEVR